MIKQVDRKTDEKGQVFLTEEFQLINTGKNEGNKKVLLEHNSNNYCKHDLLMNAKIHEQKQDTGKASKYPLPKYLPITMVVLIYVTNSLILLLQEVGV